MTLSEKLDDYFELEFQIHKEFNYEGSWVVYPLDESRNYFWYKDGYVVYFAKTMEDFGNEKYFSNVLMGKEWKTDDLTMILVDTQTDGNKFLQIFDNAKKVTVMGENYPNSFN